MIARATSDLHFTKENAQYVFEILDHMSALSAREPGVTLILGDLLDQAEQLHTASFMELRKRLQAWPDDLIVIAGNHDQYKSATMFATPLETLQGGNCHVATTPEEYWCGSIRPYGSSLDRPAPRSALEAAISATLPIVWCHHGFRGAYMNGQKIDETGATADADLLYVSGHYHLPQNVGRNVIYTGSPFEHSFSEEGQEKGYLYWTNITLHPKLCVRAAFKSTAPKHYTLHFDPVSGAVAGMEKGLDYRKGIDLIRIKSNGTKKQVAAAAGFLARRGLEAVPVLCQPETSSRMRLTNSGLRETVEEYMRAVHGADLALPSPDEMMEWATDHDLWTLT